MDLVKNAADKDQVKNAKRKEKHRQDKNIMDMQHVLGSLNGRRLMWKYLTICGIFETSFSTDTNRTMFNEGQRNIGLAILADINEANPEAYLLMMKESKGEKYA